MKEHAKLFKTHDNRKVFKLGKRLGNAQNNEEAMRIDDLNVAKRKKMADGKPMMIQKQQPTPSKG